MADISLHNVTKVFGVERAVDNLSLSISDGEFFVLLGPTGAGKTTTLRLIAGLELPDAGSVEINGQGAREMSVAERDVALVFQYYSLYPRYTVRGNLEFPLKAIPGRYSDAEIAEKIDQASKMLRIEHLLDRKTDKLSGGEMQRVSIGRAIVRDPTIFLMDEPLSNLDAKLREALRSELKDLQIKLGATFLYVTHDQVEAMSMGDRIGVLSEGHLIQTGTPNEIYNSPYDTFVASFVGSPAMNLIEGQLQDNKLTVPGAFEIKLSKAGRARLSGGDGPVTVGIRSEDVHLGTRGISARIYHVENQGVEKIVTLQAGEIFFKAAVPASRPTAIDDEIKFTWNQDRMHGFDPDSGINHAHQAK